MNFFLNIFQHSITSDLKPPKRKETLSPTKRGPLLRQKNVRHSSSIKSRAILSTDSSSSDDENKSKQTIFYHNDEVFSPKFDKKSATLTNMKTVTSKHFRESSSEDVDDNSKVNKNPLFVYIRESSFDENIDSKIMNVLHFILTDIFLIVIS